MEEDGKKALQLFTMNGFNARLMGRGDNPMIILDDNILVSCFINKGYLHFRRSPDSGEIIRSIKLTGNDIISTLELKELIEHSEHLHLYRLRDSVSGLFLVGILYRSEGHEELPESYPVFAKHRPLVYMSYEKASQIATQIAKDGIVAEIV